jgi:hypothetical protein
LLEHVFLVAAFVLLATAGAVAPSIPRGIPFEPPSAASRPAVAPCVGAIGQVTLVFNYSHATVQDCFYPVGQIPLGGSNGCAITWDFPVPVGATQVELIGLPPPPWTFEAAGPGNITGPPFQVFFVNYASTPTEAASIFVLQMVGPCYEDPYVAGIAGSVANLTARIAALSAQVTALFTTLQGVNVTTQTKIAGVQYLVSKALQEANATYSYRLIGGAPSRVGNTFTFPVFVELMNGAIANASLTGQVCKGLTVTFVNATETTPISWTSTSCAAGRMTLVLPLTSQQATATSAGSGIITLSAPVTAGTFTNLAGGFLSSQQLNKASSPGDWWSTIFGIATPPPAQNITGVGDVIADLAWFGDSTAGRALYALTSIVAILVYVHETHKMARRRIAGERGAERREDRP